MADDTGTGTRDREDTDTGPIATVIPLDRGADPELAPDAESRLPASGATSTATGPDDTGSGESAVVLVDQRMRHRRIAVLREAGQRRLHRLTWVLAPLAVLVNLAVVAHLPMFDVDRVVVEGTTQTPAATVAWASGIDRGDTLATLDEHGAERRIERLPWVAEADVVRQWPSTVRISVTERQPAAVVFGAEGSLGAIVDRHGRVLDLGTPPPFGLITITDVAGDLREGGPLPAAAIPALDLGVQLNERLPGVTTAVNVDLDATLSAGGIVRFGSVDQLDDKLVALDALVSDVDLSGLALLDLRVPSSPAVRRSG